jgi:DNA-binding MarR family transcriptional regulator
MSVFTFLEPMVEAERKLGELAERLSSVLARVALTQRRSDTSGVASGRLTPAQLSILFALLGRGPIRMAELAVHIGVRTPTVSVAVLRLELLGLVQRSCDPSDLCAVVVDITPTGQAVLRESLINRREVLVAILSELTKSEVETLTKMLAPLERLISHAVSPSIASRGRRLQPLTGRGHL